MRELYGHFEQLVQATFRRQQEASGGRLKYHSSPLREDRRYYFLSGDDGALEVACVASTDDAMWTFVNHNWTDQRPTWNQFRGEERGEAFLQLKIRELKVRLGMPWVQT